MKLITTILSLFCFVGVYAQPKNPDSLKLVKTVQELHQALVNKNTTSINQQTDKALSYGHSNGWVESKKELIKNLETNYIGYTSYKEDSITISFNENMANVRFNAVVEATMQNKQETYHLKVLEVWIKKGNRWVLFARQSVKNLFNEIR